MVSLKSFRLALSALLLAGGLLCVSTLAHADTRIFEIRTYTTHPGKLEALQARFRDHTMLAFEKHGMKNIAYWTPQDAPLSDNTLIYVIAHESREAARRNWQAFMADPAVKQFMAASEEQGKIVAKVESVFVQATAYSPLK